MVLEEIYIAMNLGRPEHVSEIVFLEMIMEGDAP